MGKKKDKLGEVTPISNPVNAVTKDFKAHLKATGIKAKDLTYDETLEKLADWCGNMLEGHTGKQATPSS